MQGDALHSDKLNFQTVRISQISSKVNVQNERRCSELCFSNRNHPYSCRSVLPFDFNSTVNRNREERIQSVYRVKKEPLRAKMQNWLQIPQILGRNRSELPLFCLFLAVWRRCSWWSWNRACDPWLTGPRVSQDDSSRNISSHKDVDASLL